MKTHIELSTAEDDVVGDTSFLYIVDICKVSAWYNSRDKVCLMEECLNQVNTCASASGKQTLPSEHVTHISHNVSCVF